MKKKQKIEIKEESERTRDLLEGAIYPEIKQINTFQGLLNPLIENSEPNLDTVLDRILMNYNGEIFLTPDGFNEAVIGVEDSSLRLIYSVSKCIEILCREMTEEEALEHFDYNVRGSFVGSKTPIWCEDRL